MKDILKINENITKNFVFRLKTRILWGNVRTLIV